MRKSWLVYIFFALSSLFFTTQVHAGEVSKTATYNGVITEVVEEVSNSDGSVFQKLNVRLDSKEIVLVENDPQLNARHIIYKKGDKVILQKLMLPGKDAESYVITDYRRTSYLLFIFILFSVFSLIVGKKYGLYALIGLFFSFMIIFKLVLPQIMLGRNPVVITVLASMLIIPVTFYLSHGFNKKTHISIFSTVITLIITAILTSISVNAAKLTGYSTEEAMFLQVADSTINMKGILLAGIIIGFLGVLDDVTVSQSSVVMQLKKVNSNLGTLDLYKRAMEIGRDHITSMINTLFLVYAGASLPLLLLFTNSSASPVSVLNMEIVADEIVRTLIGSIGLILAVPLTTFIASVMAEGE